MFQEPFPVNNDIAMEEDLDTNADVDISKEIIEQQEHGNIINEDKTEITNDTAAADTDDDGIYYDDISK